MSDDKTLAKRTRDVFHDLHMEHLADEYVARRHTDVIEPAAMDLPQDFLLGLNCADLGCGSAVHGTVNMLELGASFVHAMDVDDSFVEHAKQRLSSNADFSDRWELDEGTLEDLPYGENTFDFILCRGVIHHLENDQKALDEIHRVLKVGGRSYLYVTGRGGLLNRFFKELLREEYQNNRELREIVAKGELASWLITQIESLKFSIEDDHSDSYQASINLLENIVRLIDNDLILSLMDILEAPEYKSYTESQWFSMLEKAGFKEYYRFGRTPRYNNIRKIFAPLYSNHQHPLARLLYNDGSLNVLATK